MITYHNKVSNPPTIATTSAARHHQAAHHTHHNGANDAAVALGPAAPSGAAGGVSVDLGGAPNNGGF